MKVGVDFLSVQLAGATEEDLKALDDEAERLHIRLFRVATPDFLQSFALRSTLSRPSLKANSLPDFLLYRA